MAAVSDSVPHVIRTAKDLRQQGLHRVQVAKVDQANSTVRLVHLAISSDSTPFTHLPGQWLDVHIPSIPQAGGFTITSSPHHLSRHPLTNPRPHLELAIQHAPHNPPAAFFWRNPYDIMGTSLQVRVGGRFVYPPPELSAEQVKGIRRVVFVAGGVGINPIMSMLEYLHASGGIGAEGPSELRLLYGTKARTGERILFYERIESTLGSFSSGGSIDCTYRAMMYITGHPNWTPSEVHGAAHMDTSRIQRTYRRMNSKDLTEAIGPASSRRNVVVYVCGPPKMTDEIVDDFTRAEGMDPGRVLCEKWW